MEVERGEALPMLEEAPLASVREARTASARWHVLWTRSNCERLVADQLTAKGFELFVPEVDAWSRSAGQRRRVRVPMFRGYLFLHDAMDKAAYLAICQALGLVRVLGERWDRLATVPDAEIDGLRRVVAADVPILPHPYLHAGQRVRVTRGPLSDVEGLLEIGRAHV